MSKLHAQSSEARTIVYREGNWHEGDIPLMSAMSPGAWLSSVVFDGARAFDGVAPDLDLHCQRVIDSALMMGLRPNETAEEIAALAWEGIAKFPTEAALYVRPMYFAGKGFVQPDPDSTQFALVIHEAPLPEGHGFSACISSYRRPAPDMAPTEAKASCLYPNVARCMKEASERGFDMAIVLDGLGNVAEFATANLFIAKGGVAYTPVPNGCFLNGITRQRIIKLLREDGIEVVEKRITVADLMSADEAFSTGNYGKVVPAIRIEDRDLQAGPIGRRAKELYFAYAKSTPSPLKG